MTVITPRSLVAGVTVVVVTALAVPVAAAPPAPATSTHPARRTPPATAESSPSAALVDRLFEAMLRRPADAAGRDYWTGRLQSGDPALEVVEGLALSPEGRYKAVDRLYRHTLDRPGDPAGLAFWTGLLTDTGRADLVASFLLSSDEAYAAAGGTPAGFVDSAYRTLLGRPADAGGSAYWLGRFGDALDDGTGRFALVRLLIHSPEAIDALVTDAVTEVCGAAPSAEESVRLASLARFVNGDPVVLAGLAVLVACAPTVAPNVRAGAASRSVLPTVGGSRSYLADLPPDSDAFDPGVFVRQFDQGQINVDNGREDAAWVHDDLRVTAVALSDLDGDDIVVVVSTDLYMVFAPDAAEITRRAKELLPADLRDRVEVVVSATHNHHGPVTAFGVNDTWYSMAADQAAAAIAEAVGDLRPAVASVAAGQHRFGVDDARAPDIIDPRLNVLSLEDAAGRGTIATVVQWTNHTETTLGWAPPGVNEQCEASDATDCTAEGRYLTSDYPGELREDIQDAIGGEVLYFNGPLGSQVGPGAAPVWQVDAAHPVGNGWAVPDGALPATPGAASYTAKSFAKAVAIGEQLATHVLDLAEETQRLTDVSISIDSETFYTRLSNIGFRLLLAHGGLGWQDVPLFTCEGEPSAATCTPDGGATVADPIIGDTIRKGDFIRGRVIGLDLGDVGFMFLPGELPPELVTGLPQAYEDDPGPFHVDEPDLHAVGEDYTFPGYLLDLVDESVTFTVGLGGNELGYWVPRSDFRALCVADQIAGEGACQALYDAGQIAFPDAVSGQTCHTLADTGQYPEGTADAAKAAIAGSCTYGQALGEADGHYEETNAAGWDLVEDLWVAAVELYGTSGSGSRINPDLQKEDVLPPDPATLPAPPTP